MKPIKNNATIDTVRNMMYVHQNRQAVCSNGVNMNDGGPLRAAGVSHYLSVI